MESVCERNSVFSPYRVTRVWLLTETSKQEPNDWLSVSTVGTLKRSLLTQVSLANTLTGPSSALWVHWEHSRQFTWPYGFWTCLSSMEHALETLRSTSMLGGRNSKPYSSSKFLPLCKFSCDELLILAVNLLSTTSVLYIQVSDNITAVRNNDTDLNFHHSLQSTGKQRSSCPLALFCDSAFNFSQLWNRTETPIATTAFLRSCQMSHSTDRTTSLFKK